MSKRKQTAVEDSFRLVDILARLPAKSVVRFKCVSKRWCSILSDQQFAKSQFKFASFQHQRLLFQRHSSSSECLSFDLDPVSSFGDVSSVRKLTFPVERLQSDRARLLESRKKLLRDHVRLLASCNGLVCFTVDNPDDLIVSSYYIWNPTIGFLQKLPETTSLSPSSEKKSCDLNHFGFGYVSATDDYKFLTSYFHWPNVEMEIFSSRTNSWKRIAAPDKGFGHSTDIINGVLFNEALHWPGYFNWKQQTIVVFDLANEKFRVVPLPIKFQRSTGGAVRPCRLTIAGGCLCVWRTITMRNEGNLKIWDDQYVDMWVMREYGVSDSLTRLYRFKINKLPDPESIFSDIIRIPENGAVIGIRFVGRRETLELIKCEKKQVKRVNGRLYKFADITDLYNLKWSCHFDSMVTYKESLFELISDDYHGNREVKRLKNSPTQAQAEK